MPETLEGIVDRTFVYPIKGFPGIETPERGIRASTQNGVQGDRNVALYRKDDGLPTEWRPKGQFKICQNTEGMANQSLGLTEYDLDSWYRLSRGLVRQAIADSGLGIPLSSVVDTGGYWYLSDTRKPCVSFLNLASVEALGDFMKTQIDPRRFRMNVWVSGMEPWEELDYVRKFEQGSLYPMCVGDLRLHIDDLCERCKATEQNPETGKWDLEILKALDVLLRARGYDGSPHRGKFEVMGWLAIPQTNGVIHAGDSVVFG
ncbi:MAG TPA: hypothetical protein VJH94_04810 [Candidatus Paceibacterota bacterium]